MVTPTPRKPKTGALRVRLRRIESASGEASEELTVFCPRQQRGVTLDECAECEACESLYLDPRDDGSFLVCGVAAEVEAPPAVATDGAAVDAPSVREIMSTRVVVVRPDLSVESLLGIFIERGISGAPVVDEVGRPIGMVSKTDLLSAQFLAGETGENGENDARMQITTEHGFQVELEGPFHPTTVASATVADIMTPIVFSLPEGATVPQAAALMAYEGVHRAPVVSVDDKVVGIVSSLDVLGWVGKAHGFAVPRRHRHG